LTPLDDLSLVDSGAAAVRPATPDMRLDLDRVLGAPEPQRAAAARPAPQPGAELPLFGRAIPEDEPLITRASPPRAPLAVRRATPDVPKSRSAAPRTPSLELGIDDSHPPALVTPAERASSSSWRDDAEAVADAGVASRLMAVVIDLAILAAIDAIVVYFTMQICGVSLDDVNILPKGPLIAFLLVQNGGYFVAFTAGGQTLGKMAAGIRVVPAEAEAPLDLGRAFLRTFMWVLLAVPAGLGFLTAIVSSDRRGLHDRFAGTRVVRASA
jgi:uncharacterized RDD family membrane protein YckC